MFHYTNWFKNKLYSNGVTLSPLPNDPVLKELLYSAPPEEVTLFRDWLDNKIDVKRLIVNLFNFDRCSTSLISDSFISLDTKRTFKSNGAHHFPFISFKQSQTLSSCFYTPSIAVSSALNWSHYRSVHQHGLPLISTLNVYNFAEANLFDKDGYLASTSLPHSSISPIPILTSTKLSFVTHLRTIDHQTIGPLQPYFRQIFIESFPSSLDAPSLKVSESLFTRIEKNCPMTSLTPLPKEVVYPPSTSSISCPKKP